jgi:hypothetical protein
VSTVQEFNTLLDRLLGADAAFRHLARKYSDGRGRRGMRPQKALRASVDTALDELIDISGQCLEAIDSLAASKDCAIKFGGEPGLDRDEFRTFVRADAIIVAIAPQQDAVIEKLEQQTVWDKARYKGWW